MNWTGEDKHDFVERVVDEMIAEMTYDNMRQLVWDTFYDDLISQEWIDLMMYAERYAPDLLEDG
jgi:hypothetical protein